MKAIFKTFPVGCGDCITLRLESESDAYNIMVDCGCFTNEIEDYIRVTFNNKIHLLVVTHIDNDHISGLKTMLLGNPNLFIGKIIYNCCQVTPMKGREKLPSKTMKLIKQKKSQFIPQPSMFGKTNISCANALTLAEIILENKQWRKAWTYKRAYYTNETEDLKLKRGKFGKLVFLSPTKYAIDKLDDEFREKFDELFYEKFPDSVREQEMLFEMLALVAERNAEAYSDRKKLISSSTCLSINDLQQLVEAKESSLSRTNQASIAFMWEKENHSILFMGDASPKIVTECITCKKLFDDKEHIVDVIKVSHHGSKHSTDDNLIDVVDGMHYFFTGGSDKSGQEKPSLETIARIILHKTEGIPKKVLHFNFISEGVELLRNSQKELKKYIDFEILENNNEYEITL